MNEPAVPSEVAPGLCQSPGKAAASPRNARWSSFAGTAALVGGTSRMRAVAQRYDQRTTDSAPNPANFSSHLATIARFGLQ